MTNIKEEEVIGKVEMICDKVRFTDRKKGFSKGFGRDIFGAINFGREYYGLPKKDYLHGKISMSEVKKRYGLKNTMVYKNPVSLRDADHVRYRGELYLSDDYINQILNK